MAAAAAGLGNLSTRKKPDDPFPIKALNQESAIVTEARVERDENGKILAIRSIGKRKRKGYNPLNDPLVDLEDDDDDDDGNADENTGSGRSAGLKDDENDVGGDEHQAQEAKRFVQLLEREAANVPPPVRKKQPKHERDWIERLVSKHGEDGFDKMARDRRMNPMQYTAADIRRRVWTWRAGGGSV